MIRRPIFFSAVLPLFLLSLAVQAWAWSGKVVAVSDGDTIKVLQNGTETKVRLYGVDAPEKKQDFGQAAGKFTAGLAAGKTVEVDPIDTDRYGRTVGVVILDGRTVLNRELVKAGFAWVYPQYCKLPVCGEWKGLEATARAQQAGLWRDPNPTPPWEFRKK
jgi:endonuclease YncB( thermonuclease family)